MPTSRPLDSEEYEAVACWHKDTIAVHTLIGVVLVRSMNEERTLHNGCKLFCEVFFSEIDVKGHDTTVAYARFGSFTSQQLAANERGVNVLEKQGVNMGRVRNYDVEREGY